MATSTRPGAALLAFVITTICTLLSGCAANKPRSARIDETPPTTPHVVPSASQPAQLLAINPAAPPHAVVSPKPTTLEPTIQPLPRNWEPDFAPALGLLSGFDRPAPDSRWKVGDQLLCSLRFNKGARRELRFARVTVRTPVLKDAQEVVIGEPTDVAGESVIVLPPIDRATSVDRSNKFIAKSWRHGFSMSDKAAAGANTGAGDVRFDSDSILVSLELFDVGLKRVSTSHALATEAHLREGLYLLTSELLSVAQGLGPNADQILDADPRKLTLPPRRLLGGVMTLFALRNAIWSAPSITPILNALVRPPSIFSIITHGGIRFGLDMRFSQIAVEQRPLPASELATTTQPPLVLPFDILINGEPALRCRVITLPPQPPLQLCAGVVGVDVERPNDAGRSLEFRVLAARRGTTRDVMAR